MLVGAPSEKLFLGLHKCKATLLRVDDGGGSVCRSVEPPSRTVFEINLKATVFVSFGEDGHGLN